MFHEQLNEHQMPKDQDLSFICSHIVSKFNRPFYFKNIKVNVNLWCHICCLQNSQKIHSMTDLLDIIQYSLNEAEKNPKNSIFYIPLFHYNFHYVN